MQSIFSFDMSQSRYLSILTNVPVYRLKPFVDSLIPHLGEIEVLTNRTGLIMVPGTDTVQGVNFHLGEVLVSEAHVRLTVASANGAGANGAGANGAGANGAGANGAGANGAGTTGARDGSYEGYAACLGRDLEQSLAIAILDAAILGEVMLEPITNFVKAEANLQTQNDDQLLRRVEATRVEMETF